MPDQPNEALPSAPGDEAPPGTPGTGTVSCAECNGTGAVNGLDCKNCEGSGWIVQGMGGA